MAEKIIAFIFFIFHNKAAAAIAGIGLAGVTITYLDAINGVLRIFLTLATITILVLKYLNDKKKEK